MATDTNQVLPYPAPGMRRPQIANRLNLLHFRGDPLLVIVRHREYNHTLTLKALPQICHGEVLKAMWVDNGDVPLNLHQYTLDKIIVPGVSTALELQTEGAWLENDFLQVELPERLLSISSRTICRIEADAEVKAHLTQHSISFEGRVLNYSALGIALEINVTGPQSFYWFQPEKAITLTLSKGSHVIFSGPIAVLRNDDNLEKRKVIVVPTADHASRYLPKEDRTKRFAIKPSPDISFIHPLTGAKTSLSVRDISVLGVSVQEIPARAGLLPGLILTDIKISLFGNPFLTFTGQVVYRKTETNGIVCGIAILDISVDDHFKLIGLIHRAEDENAFVHLNHDPDKFFEFLFDTGFLYPAKYVEVHANRAAFIDAYRKLYLNPNQIARCFVYLENGEIYGHVSALKIYKHTWLNHHHAALGKHRSGLKVLRQISDFHTKSFVLNHLQMRYVVGIWRPANDFPAKFFGKFATNLADKSLCSMDTFTYLKVSLDNCKNWDDISGPWQIAKATRQDICEFEGFYQKRSGGLLTKAFDLTVDSFDDQSVAKEYSASGLKRERHIYAIRYGLDIKALVEVQDSDTGLNLSELTSAAYIYILDEAMVTPKILEFIQCVISVKQNREMSTVMLYPNTYVKRYKIDAKKEYTVWILNLTIEGADAYMKHLSKYCK